MKKKQRVEVENKERYIVTYADLLTLLLAFFVILFSMSTLDESKMRQLGGVFQSIFSPRVEQIALIEGERFNQARTYGKPLSEYEEQMMKAVSEQNNLRKVQREINKRIEEEGLQDNIRTELKAFGLKVILTNEILFHPGSAELTNTKSIEIIDFIGNLVKDFENKVSIEGHTDNVPIGNAPYPSNWELSAARATSVLREILQANPELDPTRFSATGYGEYAPIETNATFEGRTKNRRVEIIVERMYSDGLLQPKGGE